MERYTTGMKSLADLFAERNLLPLSQQNDYIRRLLPEWVSDKGLSFWRLGDPMSDVENRVLLGVATWSRYDLQLLDALAEKVDMDDVSDQIDVFDLDEIPNQNAFEQCIPGIGRVLNSPIVGIWKDGLLARKATGHDARVLVRDRYKLTSV